MTNRIFRIILPIPTAQYNRIKLTTSNILHFINRIPWQAEKYMEPSIATKFVSKQMQLYSKFGLNLPKQEENPKYRCTSIGTKSVQLQKLSERLFKALTYLELQEVCEIVPKLNNFERSKNRKLLALLSNRITYILSEGKIKENHIVEMAKNVIEQIRKAISSKAKLLF